MATKFKVGDRVQYTRAACEHFEKAFAHAVFEVTKVDDFCVFIAGRPAWVHSDWFELATPEAPPLPPDVELVTRYRFRSLCYDSLADVETVRQVHARQAFYSDVLQRSNISPFCADVETVVCWIFDHYILTPKEAS